MRPRCVLLVILGLAACGSKDPRDSAGTPKSRQQAPDERPVIAAFGNSLTEGFGVDPDRSYPDVLQRLLDHAGYRYRVANLGVSGETSTDALSRVDTVLALKPAVVVLEFGANDGLRGVPVQATRANLESMIASFRKADVPVVLAGMTLPPNYGPEYIRSFEAMFRELGTQRGVHFIPFLLAGVAPDGRYMQRDGLHPNAAGYARVAETVLGALKPLLNAR